MGVPITLRTGFAVSIEISNGGKRDDRRWVGKSSTIVLLIGSTVIIQTYARSYFHAKNSTVRRTCWRRAGTTRQHPGFEWQGVLSHRFPRSDAIQLLGYPNHRSVTNSAGRPNVTYTIAFCRKRRPMEAACVRDMPNARMLDSAGHSPVVPRPSPAK
jgi:hypothetical protein